MNNRNLCRQTPTGLIKFVIFACLLAPVRPVSGEEPAAPLSAARSALAAYRAELGKFRKEFAGSDRVPDVPFFLFGMGARAKHWYQAGQLREAPTGRVVRQWAVREAIIVPPEYRVVLALEEGGTVEIREDEEGVWLTEDGRRLRLDGSEARVNLPTFAGHRYSGVLRVLHQELLVNVVQGRPVPNLFVYPRPWLRDAAMMGMAFQATGNLHVIRDWILGLREVYDRNNAGEEEADNPGQALYLISLVSDRTHPLVEKILTELPRWEVIEEGRKYIRGRSDFAAHPVYQTKWLKFGLRALGLPDPYAVPPVKDGYSALFWWDYRNDHVSSSDARDRENYPYLGWAVDHFYGEKGSPISNRDYPLTWEQHASQADYPKLEVLDPAFAREKIAAPHTWHAAEVFLYLLEADSKPGPAPVDPANCQGTGLPSGCLFRFRNVLYGITAVPEFPSRCHEIRHLFLPTVGLWPPRPDIPIFLNH